MHAWRQAAAALVADLQHIFAARLRSVVGYGPRIEGDEDTPLSCLALVESLGQSDLDACARLASHWRRQGIATPLILPDEEFRRSLDAFPLEYGEIIRAHERLFGADPFEGASITRDDLRRACEAQIKSHLVHLREGFIESGGRPRRIADPGSTSAPASLAVPSHVPRLSGASSSGRVDATRAGALAAGLSDAVVHDVLALERAPQIPTTDAARLFPEYLAAVEQLARVVDGWRG